MNTGLTRERFVGLDQMVPLFDGRRVPYINLDNAASTPPLRDVTEVVERFLPFYSSWWKCSSVSLETTTGASTSRSP